jgi:hypothetical protein
VRRAGAPWIAGAWLAASWVAGCGNLTGFGAEAPPLVTFTVMVTGDLGPLRPPNVPNNCALRASLVWGAQWLTEPFCILPAESDAAAAVIAAGCRDPLGFVPARVAANVPVTIGTPASVSLLDLPSADVMVGDVTARVAYGSIVVYEDCDNSGTLELATPHRLPRGGRGPEEDDTLDSADVVYGASFVTMTAPDQRVAYREGAFDMAGAFYPRSGCGAPLTPGFSVLAAGGFSKDEAVAATIAGRLPAEDPATCSELRADAAVFTLAVQAPAGVREVSCVERNNDSTVRYRQPPDQAPDLTGRLSACTHLPSFDSGGMSSLIQLVISGRTGDRCQGLTHYTLRGCRENVACPVPDWDFTANPPAWWPCPI